MSYKERMEKIEYLHTQLPRDFRQFPMYQFFMETGPLEAWALVNNQSVIAGVFILLAEAQTAEIFMNNRSQNNNDGLTWSLQQTKITWFQLKKGK